MPCNYNEVISAHSAQALGLLKHLTEHCSEPFDHCIGLGSADHRIDTGYINQIKKDYRILGESLKLLHHG